MADLVPAEVEPRTGRATAAARALQERGFQVLHVGATLSVQAPESVWEEVFGVRFVTKTRPAPFGIAEERPYRSAEDPEVAVPDELADDLAAVYLAEPPELL